LAKVAVIGTGGWGKNHLRVFNELKSLTAFCDTNQEKIKLYEQEYGIRGYVSIEQLLTKEKIDAVTICTPTITHSQIAKKCLLSGIDVLVEKPITFTSKESEELVELAKKTECILTSGYIERFNPVVANLKNLIKSRKIGDPILLEFHRESKWKGNINDVGIVTDTSVHDIDTARWVFDKEPQMVFARTGQILSKNEDFATIILGFDSQKTAFIASNWVTPKRVRQLTTVCSEGVANINFITQEIQIDDSTGTTISKKPYKEPLKIELKHFIDCIDHNKEPLISAKDASNVTKIAEAALISSKSGAPIYMNL
jgi:UDP-N-acetylglucosamine 3-dehydrogenase